MTFVSNKFSSYIFHLPSLCLEYDANYANFASKCKWYIVISIESYLNSNRCVCTTHNILQSIAPSYRNLIEVQSYYCVIHIHINTWYQLGYFLLLLLFLYFPLIWLSLHSIRFDVFHRKCNTIQINCIWINNPKWR